jgi:hypothetical protein
MRDRHARSQAGPAALAGLSPRRDAGRENGSRAVTDLLPVRPKRRRERGSKQAAGKDWAARPKARKRSKFLFFFLFNYFKTFSNNFKSYFEFESNHSNQKFKCNSMSAQTCFYPYI